MPACRRLYLPITVGLLLYVTTASAQFSRRVSEDFREMLFPEFVQKVESITGCHFYFKQEELDSFKVAVKADNLLLPELLSKVFANTPFHFAIDQENNVFINTKFAIQTTLPKDFFNNHNTGIDSPEDTKDPFFEELTDGKKLIAQENILYEI